MRLLLLGLAGLLISLTPQAKAQIDPRLNPNRLTQLEAGVNWYDLNQRNLWPEDHADMAIICAAATGVMAFKLQDVADNDASHQNAQQLKDISYIWMEEAAKRRGLTLKESNDKYLVPAWTLMGKLDHDTHVFWMEHCIELTRKALPPQ